jgi:UDP-glucuronate 4-epimerase
MASQRYLITGALGCIGAWATRSLLAEGAEVWSYDLPGKPHRLQLLLDDAQLAKVHFIDGDITDQAAFEAAVVDNKITHILHLAALQVPMVRANPVLGARVNVVGSTIVMETAQRHASQIEGLVYASSIAVYGPASVYPPGPLAHDAELMPTTLYGVNKMADEWTAKIYWQDYQVPSIGVRPFFVYGPARDQGMSSTPTKAMLAAAIGRPYNIPLGGSAVYQHAEDVANVIIRASKTRGDGAPCFNLGGSKATIDDVIDAIERAAPDMEGKITGGQGASLFPEDMDQSALEAALGKVEWRDFNDGVSGTIDFFRAAVAAGKLDVERAIS